MSSTIFKSYTVSSQKYLFLYLLLVLIHIFSPMVWAQSVQPLRTADNPIKEDTYTLTVSIVGQGTTNPAEGVHAISANTWVYLYVNPAPGWAFDQWQGDVTGTDVPANLYMDGDKNVTAVFVEGGYALTISVAGTGNTIPDPGTHYYVAGRTVALTAIPPVSGWDFDHWEGDITSSELQTTITMDADKNVTAVFVAQVMYTLTTAVVGNGTITPAAGDHSFSSGTTVAISAQGDSGFAFDHWEGDLTGTEQFRQTILMDGNKSVTAVFVASDHTLTMVKTGMGFLSPAEGVYGIVDGRQITFRANPDQSFPGWRFDHWDGDITGTDNPSSLTIDSDKTVTGVFVELPQQYTLVTSAEGGGTVSPEGSTLHDPDEIVNISATPLEGWVFSHWTGDLSGSENPTTIQMTSDKTVIGVFVEESTTYSLTTQVTGSGTIEVSAPGPYSPGAVVTVTAQPASGWTFSEWLGGLSGNTNPADITMDSDKSITAVFVETFYTLTLSTAGGGTTTPESGVHSYAEGTSVDISATAQDGWRFDHWEGDLSGSTNPTSIVMDGNKSVTAVFISIPVYHLTTAVQGAGAIDPPAGIHTYEENTTVPITATPLDGALFDHWEGALSGSENPTSVLMDSDKTVTAVFVPIMYTLTIAVSGEGTASPEAGEHQYASGTNVPLTAIEAQGWQFDHWEGALSGSENPTSVLMDGDKAITAVFQQLSYSLSLSIDGNGSTDPAAGEHTYLSGTIVPLSATEEDGWQFDHWEGAVNGSANPTSVLMDGDKAVTAVFTQLPEGEGVEEGEGTGEGEGQVEGEGQPEGEGQLEGEGATEGEGQPEGIIEGEGSADSNHTADQNGDNTINLSELLRVIQFYNSGGLHCQAGTEDGFAPGPGATDCAPHDSDYAPQDWAINLSELLRLIQFYNSLGYHPCVEGEDGFCPGPGKF
ncbi:MAG TPA: hypothetical protein PLI09_28495 [Candidatus Hydrogenedentes bacterium]|nr:hypothetical protein [Candidatus Hydrogenedentota bacterium]